MGIREGAVSHFLNFTRRSDQGGRFCIVRIIFMDTFGGCYVSHTTYSKCLHESPACYMVFELL